MQYSGIIAFSLIWLFLSITECFSTTVIAIRMSSLIILGADSKVTRGDDSNIGNTCKVRRTNNVLSSYAGILSVPDVNLDVVRIGEVSITTALSIESGANAFTNAALPPLQNAMNGMKRFDPVYFQRRLEGRATTEAIFLGFENEIAHLHLRYFTPKTDVLTGVVTVQTGGADCPSLTCPGPRYVALGNHDAADKIIAADPTYWSKKPLSESVRSLIEAEITNDPIHDGPPVTVVEITKDNMTWLYPGECRGGP